MPRRFGLFSRLERSYARALYELAGSADRVKALAEELLQLRRFVVEQPDLVKLLSNRMLSMEDRLGSAATIFKGRLGDLLFRFVGVMIQRNRFDELPGVADAFAQLMEEAHGQVQAVAYVASNLDEAHLKAVADRVGRQLQRRVLIRQEIDPALMGGLKLRVGDTIYDGSVATQLELMKRELIEKGRERARETAKAL